jgi:FtsP/CotA-like multicopper oxidase with cupredoxin domain
MTTEEWYIINFTEDAHAMHLHLAQFEVIGDFLFNYTVDGEQEVIQHMGGIGVARTRR